MELEIFRIRRGKVYKVDKKIDTNRIFRYMGDERRYLKLPDYPNFDDLKNIIHDIIEKSFIANGVQIELSVNETKNKKEIEIEYYFDRDNLKKFDQTQNGPCGMKLDDEAYIVLLKLLNKKAKENEFCN